MGPKGNLASGGGYFVSKMADFPDLLLYSMTAMERDDSPDLQVKAAHLLSNLASKGTEVKAKVTAFDGMLGSLVSMVAVDNHELSKQCTCTLANLASGGYDIAMSMIEFPDLLQNLLIAMEKDDCPVLQQQAARAVCEMSSNGSGLMILDNSKVLHTLVAGLENSKNRGLQMLSAHALRTLADISDKCKWRIVDAEGVLQKLVSAMVYVDNDLVNILCATGMVSLTKGGDDVLTKMVVSFPEILDVLAGAVAKGESHDGLNRLTMFGMIALTILSPVKAREMYPVSAVMYLGRARGELLLGHYKECLDDLVRYEEGICGTPAQKSDGFDVQRYYDAQSWRLYAKAKLGDLQGSLADADSLLQLAISTGSDLRFALKERGVLRRMMGDLPGALEDLSASLGSEEEDVYEVLKHRGFVKYLMEDEEGAIADRERALNCTHSCVWDVGYGRECLSTDSVEYLDFTIV